MPELPEVETVCRGLQPLINKKIDHITANRDTLRHAIPIDDFPHIQDKIIAIYRRAKYILIECSHGYILIIHLGMSGRLSWQKEPPLQQKHDHVIFTFSGGDTLTYNDPRRFGFMDIIHKKNMCHYKAFQKLGPEALDKDFNGEYLYSLLKVRKGSIKETLLNQHIVSGLGNIYVCESLYWAKIHPQRNCQKITKKEAFLLIESIQIVLIKAIKSGGSSLKDYRQVNGKLGYFQHQWAVYNKKGQKCPQCDCEISKTGGIMTIKQSNRSSFYCSQQK